MRRPRDPRPYLQDMLACVERIRRYIDGMDQAHLDLDLVWAAVLQDIPALEAALRQILGNM